MASESRCCVAKLWLFDEEEESRLQDENILKIIKGNVICMDNGQRTEYSSGEEILVKYEDHYGIKSISAEDSKVAVEIYDRTPEIEEKKRG